MNVRPVTAPCVTRKYCPKIFVNPTSGTSQIPSMPR